MMGERVKAAKMALGLFSRTKTTGVPPPRTPMRRLRAGRENGARE